ncbi:hypothetical protein [Halorarius litoreus]|uniref:hypothetical protein n=1 Tax=Halorarius litoreus TaxID=2962676 RepID=UPI0020CD476A|nr:hypothetical protein [Halorarius litoreus]
MNALRRVVDWLVRPDERERLREDAGNAVKDLLVLGAVVALSFVIVVAAALALGTFILDAGSVFGIVGGWVGMFGLVLLVPMAVMKLATAMYGRLGR